MATKSTNQIKLQGRINHYISIGMVIFIFVAANYISFKEFFRKDYAVTDYFRLGEQTQNLLMNLKGPLKISTFISPDPDQVGNFVIGDVQQLLTQYKALSDDKITLKSIDPYLDFEDAQRIAKEHQLQPGESVVILEYNGHSKVLKVNEMGEIDYSDIRFGGQPKLKEFKGEEVISSGIQSLVFGDKTIIYFTSGHGEYDPTDEKSRLSISGIKKFIERQNSEVRLLNLAETAKMPDDAQMVVIAGPKDRFSSLEVDILKGYLKKTGDKPGNLMMLLDPGTDTGLENLLEPYGLVFNNDMAMIQANLFGQQTIVAQAFGTVLAEHPILEWAHKRRMNLDFRGARSLSISEKLADGSKSKSARLISTPQDYWGETDLLTETPVYDQGLEKSGSLDIVGLVDLSNVADGQVKVEAGKALAIGSASFLTNHALTQAALDLFLNSMNWMIGKKEALGITPKTPKEFKVTISDQQKQLLTGFCLLVLPGLGIVLGIAVWLRRRA